MAIPNRRVYFDSSVYVAALIGESEQHHAVALAAIDHAQNGGLIAVTSGLVHAEVLGSGPVRAGQGVQAPERARRIAKCKEFFNRLDFEFVDLTRLVGREAARLAAQYHLKGADACHVSMAALSECSELQTLDEDQLKIGGSIEGLNVIHPRSPMEAPGSLFVREDEGDLDR